MVYMQTGDFLITMLDLWTVSLSISCLSETICIYIQYIHMIILITLTFKYFFESFIFIYTYIYIDICIYMFSYVFSYV